MTTPMSSHIVSQFDEDLAVLRDLVLRMGGLVEQQLTAAINALKTGDEAAARKVIAGDREIDRIELRSDEEAARLLALRSPLGIDLRTVLGLGKTVSDLERVGDEAKKIAKTCLRCVQQGWKAAELPMLPLVLDMASAARGMVHDALNALVRLDLALVRRMTADDERLDQRCTAAYTEGRQIMREQPERVDAAFELVFVAKSLERIGDHAKNIGHYVHYMVEGHDSRHAAARED